MPEYLIPDWPAPASVQALQTLRQGGHSVAPWNSFNLGTHVGDMPAHVQANRALLREALPAEPLWLEQVHGVTVMDGDDPGASRIADAVVLRTPGRVAAIMTADCLPVLLCDTAGQVVGAAHAGWRGLQAGVLENVVQAMGVPATSLLAWLGPAIGPQAFEVGDEVRQAFVGLSAAAAACFLPSGRPGHWLADLAGLARLRLEACGVRSIHGGGWCTHGEADRFFSYRRDGVTGRMATLIWRSTPVSAV